jgi:DNA-binding PadR family transcriptional regulator
MVSKVPPKPTSLDYVILGIIQNTPLSGYQIRKVFEITALGKYSKSPGTIYPALKRLEKLEVIERTNQNEKAKVKFQITPKGLASLAGWLIKPLENQDIEEKREELLLRFAFMEPLIERELIIKFLNSYQNLLVPYINKRQEYYMNEGHRMPQTTRLVFEYGTESQLSTLKWCKKAIKEMKM